MSEQMSIVDIVNKVGIENVRCQTIHQSSPDVRLIRKGTELRITFSSEPQDVFKVAHGERIGIVVWFDRELLEKTNERIKKDREWRDYPIGTKAYAVTGGYWARVKNGWKWQLSGSVFPTPSGGAVGNCIELPNHNNEIER